MEDKPLWLGSKSGCFSIKSAIQLVQSEAASCLDHNPPTIEAKWDWVWKLRLPYRIQVFVWLVLHRKLLTNSERLKRNLSSNATCELCLANDENLDHVLRSCPHAQDVWDVLTQMGLHSSGMDTDLLEWLHRNLKGAHVIPNWPTKFAIVLWYI